MRRTLGIVAGPHIACIFAVLVPLTAAGSNWYGLARITDIGVIASFALLGYVWWIRAHSRRARVLITIIFLATLPLHVVFAQMGNGQDCITARSLDYTWWWFTESPDGPVFYIERIFGSSFCI